MISEFEKLSLNEMMRFEDVESRKLAAYAAQAQDPQIRNFLHQLQGMCQQHASALQNIMSQSGMAGMAAGQQMQAGGGFAAGANLPGQSYS